MSGNVSCALPYDHRVEGAEKVLRTIIIYAPKYIVLGGKSILLTYRKKRKALHCRNK